MNLYESLKIDALVSQISVKVTKTVEGAVTIHFPRLPGLGLFICIVCLFK